MSKRGNGSSKQELENCAKEIIQNKKIIDIKSDRYKVESQSQDDKFYDVSFGESGWKCSCRYHIHGKRKCKHIYAIQEIFYSQRKLADKICKVEIDEPDVICRYCDSTDCTRRGSRINKRHTVPLYECKS